MHGDFYRSIADLTPLLREELPSCVRDAILFLERSLCRSIPGLPYPIFHSSQTVQIVYPREHWIYLIGIIKHYRRTASSRERKLISRFMKTIRPLLPEGTKEPINRTIPMDSRKPCINEKRRSIAS